MRSCEATDDDITTEAYTKSNSPSERWKALNLLSKRLTLVTRRRLKTGFWNRDMQVG
jgi:hypothetical protein